ncbi:MAG: 2,3-bisphosphoglycerate-dependent phosphoglycerate mutase [Blastocatellia bacterium]|jgi:2,3-bisphosphoglycerate-dependent phosphoglycerate mutase|nr:2,3-bisphosphoglycerate-dependent phosphoglycerate mutase [Blastocatellia bacterium]
MAKRLFLVRHGKAQGQEPEAPLTPDGLAQATALADLLEKAQIHQIVASPFTRAVQSIEPLAKRLGLGIKIDERLIEANLSTINYPDWLDRLRTTFSDFELAFEGGESSRTASERGTIRRIWNSESPLRSKRSRSFNSWKTMESIMTSDTYDFSLRSRRKHKAFYEAGSCQEMSSG